VEVQVMLMPLALVAQSAMAGDTQVPEATLGAAPTRSWHDLALGVADGPTARGWAADLGLDCVEEPSPRRTTVHLSCQRPLSAAIGEEQRPGRLDRLLVARLDDGPVHHVSTERSFEAWTRASPTYLAARDALSARLGPPIDSDPAPATFEGRLVHASTRWRFSDLQVDLTVSRFGDGAIRLSERWDLPGAEASAEARPGSVAAHGSPSAARNPHLAD
jgi:hypothetical protein